MILTSQKGAGLIMALMLAQGAPAQAPGDGQEVAAPAAQQEMLIAAGEPSAGGGNAQEGAFRQLSDAEKERARNLLEAQRITPGSGPAWSLDKIAAVRQSGKPWDRIVVELQRKRLLAAGEPGEILGGGESAPRAVAEGEALSGAIATAGGPEGARTVTTGLASDISCAVPAGGTALTAAVPAGSK